MHRETADLKQKQRPEVENECDWLVFPFLFSLPVEQVADLGAKYVFSRFVLLSSCVSLFLCSKSTIKTFFQARLKPSDHTAKMKFDDEGTDVKYNSNATKAAKLRAKELTIFYPSPKIA